MTIPTKPSINKPEWALGEEAIIIEPVLGKTNGYIEIGGMPEKPAFQELNFLFKSISLWLVYLDGIIDAIKNMTLNLIPETNNTAEIGSSDPANSANDKRIKKIHSVDGDFSGALTIGGNQIVAGNSDLRGIVKIGGSHVVSVTTAHTASDEGVILADATAGNLTISLPQASTVPGHIYKIKKTDSNTNKVTIDPNGAETIDGSSTFDLISQYDVIELVSDGSGFLIVSKQITFAHNPKLNMIQVESNYTAGNEPVIAVNTNVGNLTLTLPTHDYGINYFIFCVGNIGSPGIATIETTGSSVINGHSSITLSPHQSVNILAVTGENWMIISDANR